MDPVEVLGTEAAAGIWTNVASKHWPYGVARHVVLEKATTVSRMFSAVRGVK